MSLTEEYINEYFPIVRASTLTVNSRIFEHSSRSTREERFKKELISAINSGLSDFRAPRMDPSIDKEGNICYKAGRKIAIGKSATWWLENASNFMLQKHSRIGQPKEYVAFLGSLIRKLTEIGYPLNEAWSKVCDNNNIGHYSYLKKTKGDFERTGNRQIDVWCDLFNTCKITFEPKNRKYYLFGGNCFDKRDIQPLIEKKLMMSPKARNYISIGWVVFDV